MRMATLSPTTFESATPQGLLVARVANRRLPLPRVTDFVCYAVLYRIDAAKRAETRTRRIEQYVAMLARGETIHPQRRKQAS
jgi:hypothetical protein